MAHRLSGKGTIREQARAFSFASEIENVVVSSDRDPKLLQRSDDHDTLALQAKPGQYPCMTRQSDDSREAIGKWEVQLRKGVLEFVILLSLGEREQYGFELISGIAKRAEIGVPEGTLYPLLLRLAKDGLISSRLAEGDGGAPRKYYTLTIQGRQLLRGMIPSWSKLAASVDRLLPGEST